MKPRRSYLHWPVSAALLAASPLLAQAGDGPYVGIEGGANWESPPQNLRDGTGVVDQFHFDTGWAAGIAGGYSFANGLRPELELDYRRNSLSHDWLSPADGDERARSALANLWYDYDLPGSLRFVHPYVGVGAGAVRTDYGNASIGGVGVQSDYATEFAYQAGAGLGFDLTPRLTLSLDYRHLWSDRASFHTDVYGVPTLPAQNERYLADTALVSLRYSFGAAENEAAAPPPPPAAPAPAPPPPAPPATTQAAPPAPPAVPQPPPCNPPPGFKVDAQCHIIDQTVIVRAVDFQYDSSQLTAPAQQTLDQVAAALVAQPALRVQIRGYSDSRGPASYNLKLSQRRADAVKDYLVAHGVDDARLAAQGFGPAMPIASNATAEGRAQNRRVTFDISDVPAHVDVHSEAATPESTAAAENGSAGK